jgi:hypothetical protein
MEILGQFSAEIDTKVVQFTTRSITPVGMEEERVDVNGKCTSSAAARKFLIGTCEIAFCERSVSHARRTLNSPENLTGLVLRAER